MTRTPEERFIEKVAVQPDGCWLWTAAEFTNGYGAFRLGKHQVRAHRWSYEHFVAPIPEGAVLMHSCDVKLCVNPRHLRPGSQLENQQDMTTKGRTGERGHHMRDARARLSFDLADEIRERYARGDATQRSLAAEYGVNQAMISMIVTRRRWVRPPA